MANWKTNTARLLVLFMVLNLLIVPGMTAQATGYSHTINMSNNTFDFYTVSNPNKAWNENFGSGTPGNNAQVSWDNTNLYIGYQSADLAHANNGDSENKWLIAYFGIPGVAGTNTGVNYSGQQPTLPFAAKYHLRFKAGNNNYTSLEVFDGTSWGKSKEYKWTTDMQRNDSSLPIHWKIRIPLADLGLTSTSPSLQFVASMLYEPPTTSPTWASMWGAIPDDSFANGAGIDRNFSTFYEFDLNSIDTAAASQKYLYEFTSTAKTFNSATFTFKAQTGATSVAVQQSTDLGVTWTASTVSQPLTASSTSATVSGLEQNKDYKFRLVVTGGTTAGSSLIVNVKTEIEPPDIQAPTVPQNVTVSDITKTSAKLSWTASTDNKAVTGYEVYSGTTLLATVATTSYDMTGLTEATSYAVTVKAKDAANNVSDSSAPLTVTTKDETAPTAPTEVASSDISPTGFTVSWKAATDNVAVVAYDIHLNDTLIATVNSIKYSFTGLTPQTNYSVKIKAKDASGNLSTATEAVSVSTPAQTETEPPSIPTGLTTTNLSATGFQLSWTASTDNTAVTAYEVYSNGVLLQLVATNEFVFTGLASGATYKITVKARDAAGNVSPASAELSVTTKDEQAPSVATGLNATNVTGAGFVLNWTSSTDNVAVKEYEIYRDGQLVSKATTNSYTFSDLINRISYRVAVIAVDEAGNKSAASEQLIVQTSASTPYANTILMTNSLNTFKLLDHPKKAEVETFESSTKENIGHITWDSTNIYLGYQSKDLAHINSETSKKWFIAYFGVPGVKGSADGVEYTGQKPKLPFEAKYHLRFQTGNDNYTSLEEFNGTAWVKKKEYKWNTDMSRDINSTPVFWKIKIPRADLGLQDAQSIQVVMSMVYEATSEGSMWGAVPSDAFDAPGLDKDFLTYHEFDLYSEKTAAAAQVANYKLKPAIVKATTADFSFSGSTGATQIMFHQSTDGGKTWSLSTVSQPLNANSTTATVTNLTPETDYKFKLVVVGGTNEGSSAIQSLRTTPPPDETAPSAPTELAAAGITQSEVKLSWTAATDNVAVAKYEIFAEDKKVGESTTPNFDVSDLTEETSYEFTVVAFDAAGNKSVASSKLTVKTLAAPASVLIYYKKGAGTPYISYKIGSGNVIEAPGLVLNSSLEYQGYSSITVLLNQEKEMTAAFNNGSLDTTTWDNNQGKGYVFNKGTYTFIPNEIAGSAGAIVAGTPDMEAPSAPLDLAVQDKTETSLTLTWKPATDNVATVSYVLYRDEVKIATLTGTTYQDTGLIEDTNYTYKVVARDAAYNVSAISKSLRVSVNDSIFERIDRTTDITRTAAFIDGAKLEEKMASGNFTIELSKERLVVREVRFELPASSLQKIVAVNPNGVITFKTVTGSIDLPLNALSLSTLAGRAGVLIQNLKINVVIKRTDVTLNEEVRTALQSQGSKMLMDAVEFRMYAGDWANKSKLFEIVDFPIQKKLLTDPQGYRYINRTLTIPVNVDLTKTAVMSYDTATKRFQYVPSVFSMMGDKQIVTLKSPINTVYTVVETKRTFRDVTTYKSEIELLANKGIIRGISETRFAPNTTVKRGQFAALLVRALGLAEDPLGADFDDVPENNIFVGAIGTAAKVGLVKGVVSRFSNGSDNLFSFNPDNEITRAEMAVMLERAATFAGKPITITSTETNQLLSRYSDRNRIAAWAAPSVAKTIKAGIAMNLTTFAPTTRVTRAEAAVMLKRLLEYLELINK
jgi:chitodextrinase